MRWPADGLAEVLAGGTELGQTQWFAQRASARVFLSIGVVALRHAHQVNCFLA
jgi:hypothetical protein